MSETAVESVDCLIVGGGPTGLTAATYLGRFRRSVLLIDAGESRLKRVPKCLPMNRLALTMFHGEQTRISGRFFEQWKDGNSFKHRWIDACDRACVHDLHYHDLRHTALSWLIEAGVDYAVVQRLAGHRIPGMTESYLHLWESRLREAVTVLEKVTIEKLQAAMYDERGVVQLPKDGQQDCRRAVVGSSWAVRKMTAACNYTEEWCRGTELNCRHQPFQGCALPTELPRHAGSPDCYIKCDHHGAHLSSSEQIRVSRLAHELRAT